MAFHPKHRAPTGSSDFADVLCGGGGEGDLAGTSVPNSLTFFVEFGKVKISNADVIRAGDIVGAA